MTSDRPYRKGTTFEAAKKEITHCSNHQFDPTIVEVFLSMPTESWIDLRTEIELASPTILSAKLCHP
jgi:HD-GYP domain-containing protein (c-di-GMP phosphodiesterase class II)